MYERFTDEARQVIHLAYKQAVGMHHDHLGTEHLLLGLLLKNDGLAATVLRSLGVSAPRALSEVEKSCPPSPFPATPFLEKLSHTVAAKLVLEYAKEEAEELQHSSIGTEHLLLGLYREALVNKGLSYGLLRDLGVDIHQLRAEMMALLRPGVTPTEKAIIAREQLLAEARTFVEDYLQPLMEELQGQVMERFPGLCVMDYTFELAERAGKWSCAVAAPPCSSSEAPHA